MLHGNKLNVLDKRLYYNKFIKLTCFINIAVATAAIIVPLKTKNIFSKVLWSPQGHRINQ